MEIEILKKKISSYRGEGGRLCKVSDEISLEILNAWENWVGSAKSFYSAIGVSHRKIARILGKAKKLKREGANPEFEEIKINSPVEQKSSSLPIELLLEDGKVIRFGQVDLVVDFLKKAA